MKTMNYTLLLSLLVASGSVHAMWTEDAHGNTINPQTTAKAKPQSYVIEITFNDTKPAVKPVPVIKPIAKLEAPKPGELAVDHKGQKVAGQSNKDVECLAYSIFREAGTLSENAQLAVGQVHVNRLKEGTWGNKMCEVVYSPHQFSWTSEKVVQWSQSQHDKFIAEAKALISGLRVKKLDSEDILHYHATYVQPKWAKQGKMVAQAGAHLFYKNVPY
jgi:spore germination cell wall hydrolase CwlJ-like protein